MKAPATVEQFTVAALERLGGAAEEEAPGLFTVLWPARNMTDRAPKNRGKRRMSGTSMNRPILTRSGAKRTHCGSLQHS